MSVHQGRTDDWLAPHPDLVKSKSKCAHVYLNFRIQNVKNKHKTEQVITLVLRFSFFFSFCGYVKRVCTIPRRYTRYFPHPARNRSSTPLSSSPQCQLWPRQGASHHCLQVEALAQWHHQCLRGSPHSKTIHWNIDSETMTAFPVNKSIFYKLLYM